MRQLDWVCEDDGWIARANRMVGGRYQITVRAFEDGQVFDVKRLIRDGPTAWRSSYLGSATSLQRAQQLAQVAYTRLRATHRRIA